VRLAWPKPRSSGVSAPLAASSRGWLGSSAGREVLGMYEGPQSGNQEDARELWEATRGEASNGTEAFGLLLSRVVVELQDIRATMSASVSRLHSDL
jgi:hypothetical protein